MFATLFGLTCSPPDTASHSIIPCTRADVSKLLGAFVRAIDTGDGQAIAATLATAVIFSDDRRQVGEEVAAPRNRDAVVRYFVERHSAGERFELTRGQANSNRDFEYDLKVSVAGRATHNAIGKGATNDPVNCAEQRIALWNMVREP
jgi:hypothetical protein